MQPTHTHALPFPPPSSSWRVFHTSLSSGPNNPGLDAGPNPVDPASLALTFPQLNNNLKTTLSVHKPYCLSLSLSLSLSLCISFSKNSSMENNLNSTETIPTFQMRSCRRKRKEMEKEEKVVYDDEKVEESSSSSISSTSSEEEEEEEEEVERKIVALKRMVPGGERLGVDKLFEETAEYILALQSQIKALRVLANFIHGYNNNKEMTKFGA